MKSPNINFKVKAERKRQVKFDTTSEQSTSVASAAESSGITDTVENAAAAALPHDTAISSTSATIGGLGAHDTAISSTAATIGGLLARETDEQEERKETSTDAKKKTESNPAPCCRKRRRERVPCH
jgi:hypothetical protein